MAVLDADGDGGVSLTELRDVLGEVDPDIDVEAVLASWDKDHNGILEREELFQVFSESLHA
jgi:Ca2+-binding EF-hand superfamily protein